MKASKWLEVYLEVAFGNFGNDQNSTHRTGRLTQNHEVSTTVSTSKLSKINSLYCCRNVYSRIFFLLVCVRECHNETCRPSRRFPSMFPTTHGNATVGCNIGSTGVRQRSAPAFNMTRLALLQCHSPCWVCFAWMIYVLAKLCDACLNKNCSVMCPTMCCSKCQQIH